MIFVTVGSQKFQFDRLLKAVDDLVKSGEITQEVFAQSGACTYKPKNFEFKDYLNTEEFNKMMAKCDILITHGGTGAIVNAVKAGKKVIAVPRKAKYGEHVDDHQTELISQFTKFNLILSCDDPNDLGKALNEVRTKSFASYKSNTQKYIDVITEFIDNM